MKKYRYEYTSSNMTTENFGKEFLFIDIETTGFQRNSTFLTIIGLAWLENDTLIIEQWLNETGAQEEPLLLMQLEQFLKESHAGLPHLVHYNGTTFDLPYLKAKYEQYHLPSSLSECESLDLYHLAKKFHGFLSLDGLKQKNLEECFGLFREDKLSGQELIDVYLTGIQHGDGQLLDAYLLHNKEDMEGMIFLWNLVRMHQLFEGNFEIAEWKEQEDCNSVRIKINGNFSLYRPINVSWNQIHFSFENGNVWIQVPVYHMEARFFYDNYKDYYYLPAEDRAIHKSVAEFVEKNYRIKATKETCYTKKTGAFVPLPLPSSSKLKKTVIKECSELNLFYRYYGDCTAYVLREISDKNKKRLYLKQLLNTMLLC